MQKRPIILRRLLIEATPYLMQGVTIFHLHKFKRSCHFCVSRVSKSPSLSVCLCVCLMIGSVGRPEDESLCTFTNTQACTSAYTRTNAYEHSHNDFLCLTYTRTHLYLHTHTRPRTRSLARSLIFKKMYSKRWIQKYVFKNMYSKNVFKNVFKKDIACEATLDLWNSIIFRKEF